MLVVNEHEEILIQEAFEDLLGSVKEEITDKEKQDIRRAFIFAKDAHEGVRRKSGEPYILHPIAVAKIVAEMGLDALSVMCALLHDVVEDTNFDLDDMEREFGMTARIIIDGLTKISSMSVMDENHSIQAENFRKLFLTISDDIRAILIKLADRLHNMRTLGSMKEVKKLKIASETLYLYAPLAHRLGLYSIKSELEDLSFKSTEPKIYKEISEKLAASQMEAKEYIENFIELIRKALLPTGLKFIIKYRFKTPYSVFKKIEKKGVIFEEIFDLYAIRIIIDSTTREKEIEDCWRAYTRIARSYRPNLKRLRDWISVPKSNGYESLHLTVRGPKNQWVEVQIRTNRMDYAAEKGIAAHWRYKEDGELQDPNITEWIKRIREILENPELNALDAINEFKENLDLNDVYVFTPMNEMKRLPAGSTVLDFAYLIHTNIGSTSIGAKVNQKVVSLDTILKPGDQVEVLTSKTHEPQKEWLSFVKTRRARQHINTFLKKKRRDMVNKGRLIFNRGAKKYKVGEGHPYVKELLVYLGIRDIEEMFFAIGSKTISAEKIQEFIELKKAGKAIDQRYFDAWKLKYGKKSKVEVLEGLDMDTLVVGAEHNINQYTLGTCCQPIPGDDILGFWDKEDGVVIHRTSCKEARGLMSSFGSNIIRARWIEGRESISFLVAVKVMGLDKRGMLIDILEVISKKMMLNMRKLTIDSQDGIFEGIFRLYVNNTFELEELIRALKKFPHIYSVVRCDMNFRPFQDDIRDD